VIELNGKAASASRSSQLRIFHPFDLQKKKKTEHFNREWSLFVKTIASGTFYSGNRLSWLLVVPKWEFALGICVPT
jgi:hypothetical protein